MVGAILLGAWPCSITNGRARFLPVVARKKRRPPKKPPATGFRRSWGSLRGPGGIRGSWCRRPPTKKYFYRQAQTGCRLSSW